MKKLLGSDYLLLLLYLNNKEPIKGAVRITKMMFLFKEQIADLLKQKGLDSEQLPGFLAYNYGPFSKDVYEQIELFKNIGFVKVSDISQTEDMAEFDNWIETPFIDELLKDDDDEYKLVDNKYLKYELTALGETFVKNELLPYINSEQKKILEMFKNKITKSKIKDILYYVYSTYPEYTENSLIREKVLGDEVTNSE